MSDSTDVPLVPACHALTIGKLENSTSRSSMRLVGLLFGVEFVPVKRMYRFRKSLTASNAVPAMTFVRLLLTYVRESDAKLSGIGWESTNISSVSAIVLRSPAVVVIRDALTAMYVPRGKTHQSPRRMNTWTRCSISSKTAVSSAPNVSVSVRLTARVVSCASVGVLLRRGVICLTMNPDIASINVNVNVAERSPRTERSKRGSSGASVRKVLAGLDTEVHSSAYRRTTTADQRHRIPRRPE